MNKAARDQRRRPVADFLYFAREQPNAALGYGLGLLALVAVVVFGIVRITGSSSASSASRASSAGASPAGGAAAGHGGLSAGGSGAAAKQGSHSTKGAGGNNGSQPSTTTDTGSTVTTYVPGSGNGHLGPRGTVGSGPAPSSLPMSAQHWTSDPTNIRMRAGGLTRGWVIVKNLSDRDGFVTGPGCASPPTATGAPPSTVAPASTVAPPPTAAPAPPPSCKPPRQFVVHARQYQKLEWTWHATQTGRGGAPPLAPGTYDFTIGPVTVHVTVH